MSLSFTLLFHMHHETEAEKSSPQAYDEVLKLIMAADALPIERAWLAEHHLLPTRGRLPAPLLMAVAAASRTARIGVGSCVLVLPLHDPLDLAEQIATADLLCHGRLAAGVGSGGNPEEFAAFRVPLEERRARFAEGLEVLARALTGQSCAYSGAYFQIPEVAIVPRPIQPVADLLWVAASSTQSATLAGRSGGHLLLARGVSDGDLLQQIEAYREARAAAGFHNPPFVQVTRGVFVGESERAAWAEAETGIRRHYARLPRYAQEEVDLREMARRGDFIVGTPEQCAAQIAELHARLPLTHLACDVSLIGVAHDAVARSLELLGREVIPAVKTTAGAA